MTRSLLVTKNIYYPRYSYNKAREWVLLITKPLCTYNYYIVPQSIYSCLAGKIGNTFRNWAFCDKYILYIRKVLKLRSYPHNEDTFLGLYSHFSGVIFYSSPYAINLLHKYPGSRALSSSRRLIKIYVCSVCGILSYPLPILAWV